MVVTLYSVAFWATIFFLVLGAVLGLIGVWIPEFWKSDVGAKLIATDFIFAGTALAVAVVTKLLG